MTGNQVKLRDNRNSGEGPDGPAEIQASLIEMANVIGRKWHPVIVYHLLNEGSLRFSEIQRRIDGVSDKVLSDCLESLEESELVDRQIVHERPLKVEYRLTESGESLRPIIEAVESGQIDLT